MQGASRKSLAALREQLPREGDLTELAAQLFSVVSMLGHQGSLRRALSDPASSPEGKSGIVDRLLGSRLPDQAVEIVREAARSRWSQGRDLLDALEELAVDAALISAQNAGSLDEVEDELFRFSRILGGEPALRVALTDRNFPAERKSELLHRLLDGKVSPVSFDLLERIVREPRGRTIEAALRDLSALAARRREQVIAHVTSAVELTDEEKDQLSAALGRSFGREVRLQAVVDPSLVGGLTVRVEDELIDGSVARQLAEARRKLTGRSGARRPRRAA